MFWIKMWTESRGRLPTYLLMGGSGLNVVHACINFFIFLFFWYEYKICLPGGRRIWALAHAFRGPKVLDPSSCFQRPRIFGSWLMFSEDQGFFWALAYVLRGPKVMDPGSCFQRPRIFGSWLMFSEDQGFFGLWLMFSEDQRFWILTHVFRGLGFLDLGDRKSTRLNSSH